MDWQRRIATIALVSAAARHGFAAGLPSPPLSVPELVRASDVVLTGRVAALAVGVDGNAAYTYVTLDIDRVFKGWIPEREIVVKQLGGGDGALVMDGRPSFAVRERVLVFLQLRPRDRTLMTTSSQGKWTLATDADTGAPIARRSIADTASGTAFGTPLETISLAALADTVAAGGSTALDASRVDIDVHPRAAATAVAIDRIDASKAPSRGAAISSPTLAPIETGPLVGHIDAARRSVFVASNGSAVDDFPTEPRQLTVTITVAGSAATVDLSWLPPSAGGPPTSYLVEAGSAPGLSDLASFSNGAATSLRATVPLGLTAFVRVRAVNSAGVSPPSNEVRVTAGAAVLPDRPASLAANAFRGVVKLMWVAPSAGRPVTYVFEAGSSAGATDIGTFATASSETFFVGLPPLGNYFVRVRAQNSAGIGPPSNEVSFFVSFSGTCIPPQEPPADLTASVSGSTLTLNFARVQQFVSTYVVQAGTSPGTSDIATADIGAFVPAIIAGVPPGTYYLRVRGRDSRCGFGPASNEVVITVP